jgi:restriction endonuclease Mrr
MPKKSTEALHEALEEAALAGAKEIKEFLATYRGKDPERFRRVQIAVGAVSGYTRWRASQNNMVSMMLMAARQTGVSPEQTLEIAKVAGLLPESTEAMPAEFKVIAKK